MSDQQTRLLSSAKRSLLVWRHDRVISYPEEEIDFRVDPFAAALEAGVSVGTAARQWAGEHATEVLLGILQGRFRGILESFINSYDRGLDGRPLPVDHSYPKDGLGLSEISGLLVALRENGVTDLGQLQSVVINVASAPSLSECDVAALLAHFYEQFPRLVDVVWKNPPRIPLRVPLPPELDDSNYLRQDARVRRPVIELKQYLRDNLHWAFDFCILHGSFATEDYVEGMSDCDTFGIVKDGVCRSVDQLLRLRAEMKLVWGFLYQLDPLQHHGIMLASSQDTHFYPETLFPPVIFEKALTIFGSGDFSPRLRDSSWERFHIVAQVRQSARALATMDPQQIQSVFFWKWQISLVALLPALFLQKDGAFREKGSSFMPFREALPPEDRWALEISTCYRMRNTLGALIPTEMRAKRTQDPEKYHREIRKIMPPPAVHDELSLSFSHHACWMTERLAVATLGKSHSLPPEKHPLEAVAKTLRWADEPQAHSLREYQELLISLDKKLKDTGTRRISFGSIAHPGISDLDSILEVVDPNPEMLNRLPQEMRQMSPTASYLFYHPPSMIIRPEDRAQLGRFYPIFDYEVPAGNADCGRVVLDESELAQDHLAAMIEVSCCYFFHQALQALEEGKIFARQVLMSLNGLAYSLRIVRANGGSTDEFDGFISEVRALRDNWFQQAPLERSKHLGELLMKGFAVQLGVLEGLQKAWSRLCPPPNWFSEMPQGSVVGVLFNEVYFVTSWTQEFALRETLLARRSTKEKILCFPAEFALLFSAYTKTQGIMRDFLSTRYVGHPALDDESTQLPERLRGRLDLINGHLAFLRDQGLTWGGVPHFSLDLQNLSWGDKGWIDRFDGLFRLGKPFTPRISVEAQNEAKALLQELQNRVNQGKLHEAVPLAEKLILLEPNSAQGHYLLAFSLQSSPDRAEEALIEFDRAASLGFDPFWTSYGQANLLFSIGRYLESAERLIQAERLDPQHQGAKTLRRWIKEKQTPAN